MMASRASLNAADGCCKVANPTVSLRHLISEEIETFNGIRQVAASGPQRSASRGPFESSFHIRNYRERQQLNRAPPARSRSASRKRTERPWEVRFATLVATAHL
jgi:hypothetical protein